MACLFCVEFTRVLTWDLDVVLQNLMQKPQPFFALVLSPTRELAIQIAEQFEALGSLINLKV